MTSPLSDAENERLADVRSQRYAPRTLKTYPPPVEEGL